MATSMKTVTINGYNQISVNEEVESRKLTDQEVLMCKMKRNINELEMSQFYLDFMKEVQSSPISKCIQMVLGSESKMQMVIYGIGSIWDEKNNHPKVQLSLAILMKKYFTWIGEVEVFDPILSPIEIQVLESFGCSVLSINEHGRRQAMKPTMFFMPHCDLKLYNNLIEANWKPELLSNVIIFGNSFDSYIKDNVFFSKYLSSSNGTKRRLGSTWAMMGNILAAQTFTNEFEMRTISYDHHKNYQLASPYDVSFSGLTWHFFSSLTARKMRLMRDITMIQHCVPMRELVLPEKKENLATSNPSPND